MRKSLENLISNGFSGLILGPRQVGKTTLVKSLLPENAVIYPLQDPQVRLEFERDPQRLIRQLTATRPSGPVFIDEAQKAPALFDAVQYLIDEKIASFIMTGSSARQLKRRGANLLPGRIKTFNMDPVAWNEFGWIQGSHVSSLAIQNAGERFPYTFEESLVFGSLPGIVTLREEQDRADFLRAYAKTYLEEEIRTEALTRKIGAFSRFLELAAQESGSAPNFSKLSMEAGVSAPAIREFYNLLTETLVVKRVDPFLKNARKRILSSSRYYFFDLGVRNAVARLPLTQSLVSAQKGILFEHAVMLEILRRVDALGRPYTAHYWRTSTGAEVDCVIDLGTDVVPIEIKAGAHLSGSDVRGLRSFLREYPSVKQGYVITEGGRPERLSDKIVAVPWNYF